MSRQSTDGSNIVMPWGTAAVLAACSLVLAFLASHVAAGTLESAESMPNNFLEGLEGCLDHVLANPLDLGHGQLNTSFVIIGAVLPWFCWFYAVQQRGNYRPGEEHGSARWLTPKELAAFGDRDDPYNNIILSKDARLVLAPKGFDLERDRNKNVLILGGPGSGKTRYVIKPNLMQLNSSVWVTDPKGTLLPEVGQMFVDAGYSLRTLNTIDFRRSMHFNPFAYIRRDEDIPSLVECLVSNVKPKDAGHAADPFWEQCEKMLLNALVGYMYEALPPSQRTFRTLSKLIGMIEISESNENHQSPIDVLFTAWETGSMPRVGRMGPTLTTEQERLVFSGKPHPESYAVAQYRKFKVGAGKTLKSVLMSVNSDLWQFSLPEVLDLTDYDEMDLDSIGGLVEADLRDRIAGGDAGIAEPGEGTPCGRNAAAPNGQRKTAMFVVMNDSDSTFAFLVAVLTYLGFTRLKNYADTKCLDRGGKLPIPVEYYLDEFANIGKIADFNQLITTLRSRNMATTIVLQSLSQLDNVYGKEQATTIKDACDSWVYLGGSGSETCDLISKRLGNETVTSKTASKTYSSQNSGSVSTQLLQRPLMDPSEVARMRRRDCLVLLTGTYPWKGPKYDLESHPRYAEIDPGHKGARHDRPFDVTAWHTEQETRRRLDEFPGVTSPGGRGPVIMDAEIGAEVTKAMVELMQRRPPEEIDRFLDELGQGGEA
jgi:type IV secretion system protein VirD4